MITAAFSLETNEGPVRNSVVPGSIPNATHVNA
jgi:hypothetical protein